MKRLVAPVRWADQHRVEHPPLMMKALVQGVCGGLRWLETKALAQYLARRALQERQMVGSRAEYAAFALRSPRCRLQHSGKKVTRRRHAAAENSVADLAHPVPRLLLPRQCTNTPTAARTCNASNALLPVVPQRDNAIVVSSPQERVVRYDVLDCTFGSGYHTGAVLENGAPYTRVVALDCDYGAIHFARSIESDFGPQRFKFFASKMSEAKALFGEKAFDAVMVDPGPSMTQLHDPARGFALAGPLVEGNGLEEVDGAQVLDLRYCTRYGDGALHYLNTVPQNTLASALTRYGLLQIGQAMKLARAVRVARPFANSLSLVEAIESAGVELPEEGWFAQDSLRKVPMSWRFFVSLRGIINAEQDELRAIIQDAFLLLRDEGRLVVFTRLPWEETLVKTIVEQHPYALLSYAESIEMDEVGQYGFSRHTKMWVIVRRKESTYALKNAAQLTPAAVEESALRWMGGLYAGQTHGFPAENFAFESLDARDRATQRRNAQPVPFDEDDKATALEQRRKARKH